MRTPPSNTLLRQLSALLNVPYDDLQLAIWKLYEPSGSRLGGRRGKSSCHNTQLPEPPPLDRLNILLWQCGLSDSTRRLLRGNLPSAFSRTVETEIKRISKLPEPMRTVRAVDFIERYVDANTLAMAVREKYHRVVEEQERVEDRLAELARLSTKKAQKEAEADAEAERRYYWYRR